ncbi:MAG: putative manganese-dependent inorganic diphosphatase [Deltaproteobacteria bacterium]|nr:MAG: putative manganese-dependent inorganic diphosphatase [Deltaproteobacteria bacterium]
MRTERVYVVGHRNPDTDSICSAMAYARLLQRQGRTEVLAGRAGHLNRQTEFVLDELSLPQPELLNDVYPRVGDIIGDQVVTLGRHEPLSRAMELFHLHNIRQIPVVDAERHPCGLLVLKRITERFLVPRREADIRRVRTSMATLARCLRGEVLAGDAVEQVEELDLYVGAMSAGTFGNKLASQDPRRMVLLTGDREEIQARALESSVRALVVTGGLRVDAALVERAGRAGTALISTPFDTATSAWLSRLATPVGELVSEDFLRVEGHERVEDVRLKLLHHDDPGAIVVDSDGRVAGILTKSNLLQPSPVRLILVDHNELGQAVPGADKVEILEVVDHHRLGNFHTDQPIRFVNQPVGSTCTVVAGLYRQAGLEPEPAYAALMLAGLMSDTVLLKSPTTTDIDRQVADWLGGLCGYDGIEFGRRMFQAGSSLAGFASGRDLVLSDFKEFAAGKLRFGVGQVEVVSFEEFHERRDELEQVLALLKEEKGLDMIGLLVTDIVHATSLLLALGGRELPYLIGYPAVGDNLYELKNVLSRKKQLVPHLLKVLQG